MSLPGTWYERDPRLTRKAAVAVVAWVLTIAAAPADGTATLSIRGRPQVLHLYGPPAGEPVVVSSGDGGWIHLGPHVAGLLAGRGYFVVGFDVRAYLAAFTSRKTTLQIQDEPADFRMLAAFASRATGKRPVLIGISEGAGLSVLAATDQETKKALAGVLALGLPDRNELGWRWRDSLIYLTHTIPNEPTFSAAAVVGLAAPVPIAAIHSTHDEFVPVAEIQRILGRAGEPKRLWIVSASDHRFSDNLSEFDERLMEAMEWIKERAVR